MTEIAMKEILDAITERVCAVIQPKQIILFGSLDRGDMHNDSDIDILVIVPSGTHRRKTAQAIYRNLIGIGFASDIIVVTEEDIIKFKNHPGMINKEALEEGEVLYAA